MPKQGNPYEPPKAAIAFDSANAQEASRPLHKVLIAIVVLVIFRFFSTFTAVFFALIDVKGLGVNWPVAGPIVTLFGIGCLMSHFMIDLNPKSTTLAKLTGWPPYLAGAMIAVVIVVLELHPSGF